MQMNKQMKPGSISQINFSNNDKQWAANYTICYDFVVECTFSNFPERLLKTYVKRARKEDQARYSDKKFMKELRMSIDAIK